MTGTGPRKYAAETRGRPFQPGNPGRPRGARNRATLAVEALLEGEAEGLTRKAVTMALAGHPMALSLCLQRICPPPKQRPVEIDLPETTGAEGVRQAMDAVLAAVARGELTPGEGQAVTEIVEAKARAVEIEDIERRLRALERGERRGREEPRNALAASRAGQAEAERASTAAPPRSLGTAERG